MGAGAALAIRAAAGRGLVVTALFRRAAMSISIAAGLRAAVHRRAGAITFGAALAAAIVVHHRRTARAVAASRAGAVMHPRPVMAFAIRLSHVRARSMLAAAEAGARRRPVTAARPLMAPLMMVHSAVEAGRLPVSRALLAAMEHAGTVRRSWPAMLRPVCTSRFILAEWRRAAAIKAAGRRAMAGGAITIGPLGALVTWAARAAGGRADVFALAVMRAVRVIPLRLTVGRAAKIWPRTAVAKTVSVVVARAGLGPPHGRAHAMGAAGLRAGPSVATAITIHVRRAAMFATAITVVTLSGLRAGAAGMLARSFAICLRARRLTGTLAAGIRLRLRAAIGFCIARAARAGRLIGLRAAIGIPAGRMGRLGRADGFTAGRRWRRSGSPLLRSRAEREQGESARCRDDECRSWFHGLGCCLGFDGREKSRGSLE